MDTRAIPFAVALCLPLLGTTHALADDAPLVVAMDDQAEFQSLLNILEEQTEIATKTKLNADYVPGMVTVLHGITLESGGVNSVWEALRRVPGFYTSRDRTGNLVAVVRGSGGLFASGNLKVLLDGIAMNESSAASADLVFSLPIEQVERIEVIRGPGSVVHGEFAYSGVVNVVTRKEGTRAFAGIGQGNSRRGGLLASWQNPEQDSFLSLNMAGSIIPRGDTQIGNDWLHAAGMSVLSNAPGTLLDGKHEGAIILNGGYRDLTLTAHWTQDARDDFAGKSYLLPPAQDGLASRSTNLGVQMEYQHDVSASLQTKTMVGLRDYSNWYDAYFYPAGMPWPVAPGALIVDTRAQGYYSEREWRAEGDLTWNPDDQNTALLSLSASRIDVVDSWMDTTVDRLAQPPLAAPTHFTSGVQVPIDAAQGRTVLGITLQEEYRPSEAMTLTGGVRYDRFSDVGGSVNPRFAAVWRLDRSNILKVQYAEAFRPPTFLELHNGIDVKPETIASIEIGYIHRGSNTTERVTLFQNDYRDLILENSVFQFHNAQTARAQGIEVEEEVTLGTSWIGKVNVSYLTTRDRATGAAIAGTTPWLGNLIVTYTPVSGDSLELSLHYVGTRYRETGDSRAKLGAETTADLSGVWSPDLLPELSLSGTVRNLFNVDTHIPAMLTPPAQGSLPGYPNDLPGSKRSWWLKLAYTL